MSNYDPNLIEGDGLVQRVIQYQDRERTIELEKRETFRFRKDKLEKRETFTQEGRVVEHFARGRMPKSEVLHHKKLQYLPTLTLQPCFNILWMVRTSS